MDSKKWKVISIPLPYLEVSPLNIRKTGIENQLESLKQNIQKNGLFDAIYVLQKSDGKYAVIKGQRRLKALQALAKIDPDRFGSVPAILVDYTDDEAVLASITEDRLKQPVGEEDYCPVVAQLEQHKGKEDVKRSCGFNDIEEVNYYLGRAIRTSPETVEKKNVEEKPSAVPIKKGPEREFMPQKIEAGKVVNPFAGMYSSDIGIINAICSKTKEKEADVIQREKSYLAACSETPVKVHREIMDRFQLLAIKNGSGSSYYEFFEFIRKMAPKYLDENHIMK